MFPQEFIAEMLDKYPKATATDADRISAWIASKHATKPFNNPHAMFEKLLRTADGENSTAARFPITAPRPKADQTPYSGFDATGSCLRSAVPVTNLPSDFARWIVREIRDQLLAPADVVRIVRQRDQAIWQAIGIETLREWATHTHFAHDEHGHLVPVQRECDVSCWASLTASSGLAECIRSWGGWYPWANDRNAWAQILEREATRRPAA